MTKSLREAGRRAGSTMVGTEGIEPPAPRWTADLQSASAPYRVRPRSVERHEGRGERREKLWPREDSNLHWTGSRPVASAVGLRSQSLLSEDGGVGGIRTHTVRCLRPVSLPVGVRRLEIVFKNLLASLHCHRVMRSMEWTLTVCEPRACTALMTCRHEKSPSALRRRGFKLLMVRALRASQHADPWLECMEISSPAAVWDTG